jgi:hypothetical protein
MRYKYILFGSYCVSLLFSCMSNKKIINSEYTLKAKKDDTDYFNNKSSNLYNDKMTFYFFNDSITYYKYFDAYYNEPYYNRLTTKRIADNIYTLSYNTYNLFNHYEIVEIADSKLGKDSIRLIYQLSEPNGNLLSNLIINDTALRFIRPEYPNERIIFKDPLKSVRIVSFLKPALYTDKYYIKDSTTNTLFIKYKYFYTDRYIWPIDTSKTKFSKEIQLNMVNYNNENFSYFPNRTIVDTVEIKRGKVYFNKIGLKKVRSKKKSNLSDDDFLIFKKIGM